MIDTQVYMDDVQLAKELLDNAKNNGERLSHSDIVFGLRNLLKLKYYPVAIKFFYKEDELEAFKAGVDYRIGLRPYTFCHFVAASRQRGDILLGTRDKLGCSNAKYVFGWKDLDEGEIKSHLKYTKNREQAEKFIQTKKRLPPGLLAFATAPLHKAPFQPDLVHGMCDPLQSYHLANDWCAAFDSHPFQMTMTMNSSICHGCVQCYVTQKPNVTQMCSSSKTAGKTEQSEVNYIWPYDQIEPTFHWTLERTVRDGGVSFPRTGETYPGFDICKLCTFIAFPKGKDKDKDKES
ncbi:MAG: DUF169 domain-containing protein [Syntrophobacteraceae bacterium]|nr:DUF169 domain-containing protein [Syntrophobacteraceae bacterium]